MSRIRLIIEYEGTGYSGWQRQRNAPSVQQTLEEAVSHFNAQPTAVTGASRTDAGVHALGQSAHFDAFVRIPPEKWAYALNTRLPPDIRVRASEAVAPDFHARFHAKGKVYQYRIANTRHAPALGRQLCAFVPLPLDVERMRHAAEALIGRHDFAAFAASGSIVRDTVRTVRALRLQRVGEQVQLFIWGDGFLYNMVRIIAGTLTDIGLGKLPEDALAAMIRTRDRLRGGSTAPAAGLTLLTVLYTEADTARAAQSMAQNVPNVTFL